MQHPVARSPLVTVWPEERVQAVRKGLLERFSTIVPAGSRLGLRQGEILGLSSDDIDRDAMALRVQRQLKTVRGVMMFAPPKGGKMRTVPIAPAVLAELDEHEEQHPAAPVALP